MADCPHTIGVEFGTRIIEVSGQKIKLQIWDIAIFKVDNQQDPTVQSRELCSTLYGNLDGRGVWGKWIHIIYIPEKKDVI